MKAESFEYIEVFYNRKRQHSTLGYRSPALYCAVDQRATPGKTGSMNPTLWQTKNRGNLKLRVEFYECTAQILGINFIEVVLAIQQARRTTWALVLAVPGRS
jgi:hypothetical protein